MVLAGLGLAAREYLKRQQERDASRDAFLRALIATDREDRRRQQQAWQELVERDIEAKQAQARALDSLCEGMRAHEKRADERHQTMIETIRVANGRAR